MRSRQGLVVYALTILLVGCISHSPSVPNGQGKAVDNYMNLAKGYIQEGYIEKAVKPLNRALEIEPRSSDVHGMLGLVYQLQGETRLAEKSFKKALSYNSGAAEVRNNYGAFLFSRGRLDDAYREFSKAAENIDYEKRSRAYENMGVVAHKQGNLVSAQAHFEKSLRLNSNLPRARLELATVLHKSGDYGKAWAHYLMFAKQARQNSQSLWLGVQLARVNGDKNAAASYGLQLERLFPGSKELQAYRSLVRHE
ncbi:type IV pilus biogenesis/stability protein PilW [Endozoicomonas sp. Mp262]|uniref:type IV pilus biogenesis/stability protein PilW n=1 Tax=Endozoicomonas sp. Mp262 TaxID=2919499 RepID=UPI0021D8B459